MRAETRKGLLLLGALAAAFACAMGATRWPLAACPEALGATPVAPAAGSAEPGPSDAADATPLPELPKLQPISSPAPSAAAVKELDDRLSELVEAHVSDPLDPKPLHALTADLGPDIVPAIAQRLQELRKLDGAAAEALLDQARKAGRKALDKAQGGKKRSKAGAGANDASGKDDAEGDWLVFMLAIGNKRGETWRDAVQLYGMMRMLEAVGSTPAVRVMVDSYSTFGELVRIDLRRALGRLGDKAVAALLEARKHDTPKVARWAAQMLDAIGRAIPGEAVSSTDPEVLADVLRAFGRTRDVDAVRVILSFCSSDRVSLREAAREAIAAIGEPATWQLKDAYQQLTGEKAPKGWSWDRTARELFRLHDKARLSEVGKLVGEGTAALGHKRFGDATGAFDQVLARSPLYERRADMAPAYVGRAEELAKEGKRELAIEALRKALRLRPQHADNAHVESRLYTLEAEMLAEAGTPDRFILQRALELDPGNEQARGALAALEAGAVERQGRSGRLLGALGVGLAALVALVLIARWPGRKKAVTAAPKPAEAKAAPKPGTSVAPAAPEPTAPPSTPPAAPEDEGESPADQG
jgi:tetratricopeptide (TPR) repeat protein